MLTDSCYLILHTPALQTLVPSTYLLLYNIHRVHTPIQIERHKREQELKEDNNDRTNNIRTTDNQ